MSRITVAARSAAALASLALLAACGDRSGPAPLEPRDAPAFLSAGSSSSDWQQCANNGRNDAIPCEWINSVLNPGKATYREGELIPFRFAVHLVDMENKKVVAFKPGAPRSVTFTYGFNKGANGNYDFIGKFNQTEGVRANLCSADFAPVVPKYCVGPTGGALAGKLKLPDYGPDETPPYATTNNTTHTVITIDSTKFLQNVPATLKPALSSALKSYLSKPGNKLEIDVFGGVGTSVDPVIYNIGGSDVTATITVRFTANQPDVLIAFGAHFARLQDWEKIGYNGGAGQSGSPFHIKVDNIDGTTVGALGNNVAGGVVVREANVSLVKTVSASTITVGQSFFWEMTATNNGDGDAVNQTLTDQLPQIAGYTFSTPTAGCSISSGVLTCTPITVAANGGTFTARVNATFTGPVTPSTSCGTFPNTATIGGGTPATVNITIQCPTLNVVKVADNLTVSAGSPIGFVITVNSVGPGAALGTTLSDALPTGSGITWTIDTEHSDVGCSIASGTLSCSFGDLAAGQSRSVHVTSPTTAASCQAYPNTATAQATNHAQVQAQATTTVQCPNLDLTKVADQTTVSAGTAIGFTMTVSNGGSGTATGVTLTDVLPTNTGLSWTISPANAACSITNGTLTCNFGSLAPGATASVHVTSPTVFATCGTVNNTANVTTTNNGNDQASASVTVQCPNLSIQKLSDQNTVSAGMPIAFTVIVSNAGPGTATSVTLNDPLPGGSGVSWSINPAYAGPGTCQITGSAPSQTLSCSFGNLASGASASVKVTSPTTAASCKAYANTATAQATNHAQVQASETITVQCPQLGLTKVADQGTVSAGDAIGFTMTVTNSGAGTATGVTLTDALPSNAGLSWSISPTNAACSITGSTLTCNFGSLGPGGTASVHITSPTTFASCGTVNNTANVTTTNNGSDQASASVTVRCPALEITKAADAATVSAGSPIGFTVTVRNTGAGIARSVTLSDALPTGTGIAWTIDPAAPGCSITSNTLACSFGDLAQNATRTVHLTSPTTAASCQLYTNTATAQATNHAQVQAQASTTVQCPSISLTKTADAGTVSAGTAIGFTMTVTNAGPGTATGVTLTDVLPTNAGLSWTISPSVQGCSIAGGTLTCNFGTLGVESRSVHVTSPTTFASCGTVNNTATVTTSNNGTDEESASITVQCPSLSITKTADAASVSAGSPIGFTIQVSNAGPGTAAAVTLNDALPGGTGVSWSINPAYAGPGTCQITGSAPSQTLSCSLGALASGASASVHVRSSTTPAACKVYANTATAQATNHAQVQAQASTEVLCPTLGITKTPASQTKTAGEPFSWTVTLSNSGAGTALGATINDPLPVVAGVAYTLGAGSDASCAITSGTLTCGPKDLATNATLVAVINATTTVSTGCSANAYTNTATGAATGVSNVQASATVTLNCPQLAITKTPDQVGDAGYSVNAGGTATFTVTVTNTGSAAATNVVVKDTLPNSGLNWSENSASCSIATEDIDPGAPVVNRQVLTCTLATLAAVTGSFSVQVSTTVPVSYTQVPPSPAGTPLQIDGNLIDDGAGNDWANVGINCLSNPLVGCRIDDPSGQQDGSFGQGTSEDTAVPSVVDGGIPPEKSDLLRFYIATERFVSSDYLYLAWERVQEPNGTTNMDFELNQSRTLSANNTTPVRTAGDILIKYDLAKGGTTPVLGFHRWVTAASAGGQTASQACEATNKFPCWGKGQVLSTDVAGAINTVSVDDPINPDATRSLDPRTFGEARINLQASGIFQTNVCLNFGSAYLKSRSSDSFTAAIKDFVAPVPISINSCQDVLIPNKAWVSASNFAPAGGSAGGGIFDAGQIKIVAPTASLFTMPMHLALATVRVDGSPASPMAAMAAMASGVTTATRALKGRTWLAMRRAAHRTDAGRVAPAVMPATARWRGRLA